MTDWASVRLGSDLRLVVSRTAAGFEVRVTSDDERQVLDIVATTVEPPSDAILSAARATAILLHAERVEPPVDWDETRDETVPPHAYERDRSKAGFPCRHCAHSHRHEIHDPRHRKATR